MAQEWELIGVDEDESDFTLIHFGVKGMKWGVRKSGIPGVSMRTNHAAKKDAKEFTQAKMYYGEGAGTRRKLIKAKVEARSKRDPYYKKAFDHHVANTDMSKRANQAQSKRRRTDTVNTTKKTARGIHHILNGNPQYASAAAATIVGAVTLAHKTGADKIIKEKGQKLYKDAMQEFNNKKNKKVVVNLLKDSGFNVK